MRPILPPILLLLASLPIAGCTAADEPAAASVAAQGHECFRAEEANSFSPVGENAVNVGVGARRYFRLELAGACPDIDWTKSVAIRTRGPSWICRGHDADLIVPGALGAQSCPVRAVRPLTEAEVEAFRASRR
ncbi:MAG: DUF6491 family protein [Pseudomonadota bacterium]|nr:DUF6491 family protein [Pseudomonadota bacterium]